MAKWGEGDPRWIVEERPDAINVNNWHWTEKNACGWSETKFKELFENFTIENDLYKCTIEAIENCDGEASANNRKGKLIFFYEWAITLKWKGKVKGGKNATGKVVLPNVSEENDASEVDVNVTVNETTVDADVLKEFMRDYGAQKIREQIKKYIDGLKAEFSQGMILPKKDGDEIKCNKDSISNLSAGLESKVQMTNVKAVKEVKNTSSANNDGLKLNTTTLSLFHNFICTGEELYNVLTVPEMVIAFTHGPVNMEVKKGGKFSLFDGNIHGEFVEVVPNKKIVQTWRYKRWPTGHFSTVTMEINQMSDYTELKLNQTDVPAAEADSTFENWDKYYWQAIKRTFGFGCFL